ncbi:MAG: protein translocase subunit SecF [Eubacteriaceae bacterium]|nr:protein translocase subunit SecF [Eubacteriaceae bacterium]
MKDFAFIEKKRQFFMASLALAALFAIIAAVRGFNLGIDIKGGSIAILDLHKEITITEAKSIVNLFDPYADIAIVGDDGTKIAVSSAKEFSEPEKKELFARFESEYSLAPSDLVTFSALSPAVGKDLFRQAIIACAIALCCIFAYISIRFAPAIALASLACILHDVIIVLGIYSALHLPVNAPFAPAMIAVLCYSANNTLIVFDKTRKSSKTDWQGKPNAFNELIRSCFGRVLNATILSMLPVFAVITISAGSVRQFVLPMAVGILASFYSSIFLALPLWHSLSGLGNAEEKQNQR